MWEHPARHCFRPSRWTAPGPFGVSPHQSSCHRWRNFRSPWTENRRCPEQAAELTVPAIALLIATCVAVASVMNNHRDRCISSCESCGLGVDCRSALLKQICHLRRKLLYFKLTPLVCGDCNRRLRRALPAPELSILRSRISDSTDSFKSKGLEDRNNMLQHGCRTQIVPASWDSDGTSSTPRQQSG